MGILRRLARWTGSTEKMKTIVAGQKAPDFSLKSLEGKEYSLTESLGARAGARRLLQNFLPRLSVHVSVSGAHLQRYGREDVAFLGISQDDSQATKEFADEYGVTFPVLLDAAGYPASNAYGLTNVPTTFLIDTNGVVKLTCDGFNKKELEAICSGTFRAAENPRRGLVPS